ncbi:hypothetical protein ACJX0J_035811, partial [Zea mays]
GGAKKNTLKKEASGGDGLLGVASTSEATLTEAQQNIYDMIGDAVEQGRLKFLLISLAASSFGDTVLDSHETLPIHVNFLAD